MRDREYVLDAESTHKAFADYKELIVLSERSAEGIAYLLSKLDSLTDQGLAHICPQIDDPPTMIAGRIVVRYQIAEALEGLLTALRARYANVRPVGDVTLAATHAVAS